MGLVGEVLRFVCLYVCLFVCLFVCFSARISQKPHQIFCSTWPLARSSCDGSAIRYVLPSFDFVDDVMFSHNGAIGQSQRRRVCFVELARKLHRGRSLPSPTASCFDCAAVYRTDYLIIIKCWDCVFISVRNTSEELRGILLKFLDVLSLNMEKTDVQKMEGSVVLLLYSFWPCYIMGE